VDWFTVGLHLVLGLVFGGYESASMTSVVTVAFRRYAGDELAVYPFSK